jgi:hypothetical protein
MVEHFSLISVVQNEELQILVNCQLVHTAVLQEAEVRRTVGM